MTDEAAQYARTRLSSSERSECDKFNEAAREHGDDEDEKRWEERLRKIAEAGPEGT